MKNEHSEKSKMIEIDGSQGEGGGQMVRSSLALSAITGKPARIFNLRARRAKPGLARQHLTAVNAAAEICDAEVTGNELHSQDVCFVPGSVNPGQFHFRIGTAGSTTLVAQTILPPLMLANGPSVVRIDGGTHNEKAPPFEYLQKVYLPLVQQMGPSFDAKLINHGFYPAGGGSIKIEVSPTDCLCGLNLVQPIGKVRPYVRALVSKIPTDVAQRECDKIRRKSNWDADRFEVVEVSDSPGPGNAVMITLESELVTELFSAIGKRGIRAEQVAANVYRDANAYLKAKAPVGEYLADQLLMPLGLAAATNGQESSFVTTRLSDHSLTHIKVLKRFLDIEIAVENSEPLVQVKVAPIF